MITQPSEGAGLTAVGSIDGTGTPGLTVRLSGAVTASGVVAPDGTWSIPLAGRAVYGKLSVTSRAGGTQPRRQPLRHPQLHRGSPPAPADLLIPDGLHFSQDGLPATISGSGVDGAEVTVLIDGVPAGAAQTGGGRWSVPFPAGLAAGPHTLSVSQAVDGVAFRPGDGDIHHRPGSRETGGRAPGGRCNPRPSLRACNRSARRFRAAANTGAGALLPAAGLGAGAFLLGGVLLVVRRRAGR